MASNANFVSFVKFQLSQTYFFRVKNLLPIQNINHTCTPKLD